MPTEVPDPTKGLPPGVPRPPSQADIDQVSEDQALIADEWAPAPPHPDEFGDGKTGPAEGS